MTTCSHATLGNLGRYTVFSSGDEQLTFIAPYSLIRYECVKEWDHGYLVVMARYAHSKDPIEEYLDLVPVLENLLMDPDAFLDPIKVVEISHD